VRHLPPAVHAGYVQAVAAALHPVFVVAAIVAVFSFFLTFLLREVPLRDSTKPLDGEELAMAASPEAATVSSSST
jgi:hypothetical protein